MERQVGVEHACDAQFIEQLRGEMQPGGGGGGGDLFGAVGVNGLVTFEVGGALFGGVLALDVGRERHFAEAVGDLDDVGSVGGGAEEADPGRAFGVFFQDGSFVGAGHAEGGSGGKLFSRAQEAPPSLAVQGGAQEQAFDGAAGGTVGEQAGGQDGGVVAE